jgi:DNA-binding Lrp family transcriptional regulator
MKLTTKDRRIIRALQQDASRSFKELAEALDMSPASVWRSVQELEKAGLITRRVALTDPIRLGLAVSVVVQVHLKDHSQENRKAFEQMVANEAMITQCCSLAGGFDYFLMVRAEDIEAFETFMMMKLLSHPAVATTNSNVVMREQKFTTELPVPGL